MMEFSITIEESTATDYNENMTILVGELCIYTSNFGYDRLKVIVRVMRV